LIYFLHFSVPILVSQLNLASDALDDVIEEGEAMDTTNEDDTAMMAMMGMSGFGTTKVWSPFLLFCMNSPFYTALQGTHVEGNQEGAVNVKKIRTWRQYMNRWVKCPPGCLCR